MAWLTMTFQPSHRRIASSCISAAAYHPSVHIHVSRSHRGPQTITTQPDSCTERVEQKMRHDAIHSTLFCFAQRPTCNLPQGGCSCLGPCFETARLHRKVGLMLNQTRNTMAANEHDRVAEPYFGISSLMGPVNQSTTVVQTPSMQF